MCPEIAIWEVWQTLEDGTKVLFYGYCCPRHISDMRREADAALRKTLVKP
jgi:hypothetical protein